MHTVILGRIFLLDIFKLKSRKTCYDLQTAASFIYMVSPHFGRWIR